MLTGAVAAGLLFGVAVSLTNAATSSVARVLSLVIGVGWFWAAVAVAAGRVSRTKDRGALAGACLFLAAVAAYYAVDLAHGVYDTVAAPAPTPVAMALGDFVTWAAVALLAGPALGMVGAGIRPGGRGLLCALVVPVGAAVEMVLLLGAGPVAEPVTTVTRLAVLLGAVVAAEALVWRFPATREAGTLSSRESELA